MDPVDLPCHHGKFVFLSKPRTLVTPDASAIIEVDVVLTTLVFRRQKNEPIVFCGAFVDVLADDRIHRVPYLHAVDGALVAAAQDRALDACAEHDVEPPTERRGAP